MIMKCGDCGSTTAAGALCGACIAELYAALRQVPAVTDDLLVTFSRQDKVSGASGGGRSATVPLPWKEAAAKALLHLNAVLVCWVRAVEANSADRRGYTDTPAELSNWLERRGGDLCRHVGAVKAKQEIVQAVTEARRVTDRPPVLHYRGPCDECSADLYVPATASEARCGCGASYDAEARRAWLMERVDQHLATASEIARGLSPWLAQGLSPDLIYQWHHRKRLVPHGVNRFGRPLFRVGEVIALLVPDDAKVAKRQLTH